MARSRQLRKRCEKCGWTGMVRPRERRCKQRSGMMGTYSCWGLLVAAPIVRTIEEPAYDDKLERKLTAAHVALDANLKRLSRVTTAIRKHQRIVRRLEAAIGKRDQSLRVARGNATSRVVQLPEQA